jgi:hypothetical protein
LTLLASEVQQPLRRIEDDSSGVAIDGDDDPLDKRYEDSAPLRRVDLQERPPRRLLETHRMAQETALAVLTRKACQFVAVIEAVGRRECFTLGNAQFSPHEAAGGLDVANPFERQEHPFSVRAGRQHADAALVGTTGPEQRKPRDESFRETGRDIDRQLARKTVRTANDTDEQN